MNPRISILIPVYNVEVYLRRCLDSILVQEFTDFECLLADDGSSDKSAIICDEYEKKDSRIKVIHKQNEGISATREFLVQQAKGEFIQFVDSDDWIEPTMLAMMYSTAIETKSDIVGCNFIQEYKDKSIPTRTFYKSHEAMLQDVISSNWGVLWKLLIKRSIIKDHSIHFPKGIDGGEDYYYVANLLIRAKSVACVDEYLYHYNRSNLGSFITNTSTERVMYQVEATKLVEKSLLSAGLLQLYHEQLCERKCSVKCALLKHDMVAGCKVFTEIDIHYLNRIKGKKNRIRFVLSQCLKIIL